MQDLKRSLKKILPKSLYRPFLPIYHWLRAVLANLINGFPANSMKVVAVTGTNGKTTTVSYIAEVLRAADQTVGVSSTAYFRIGDKVEVNDLNMTVTNPFALQKLLKRMKNVGVEWVVLEVTSHSLHQRRVWGIKPQVAVMTNLTQDHLDYHGTMDAYAKAKALLFKKKPPYIVLNHDDSWFEFFNAYKAKARKLTYGTLPEADCQIVKATLTPTGSKLAVDLAGERTELDLKLVGKFNAYNAMAAAATGTALGIDAATIKKGIEALDAVPGRMERVSDRQRYTVIVDYAHTPDALKNVLETLRGTTKGRIITVFGATGDRDKAKRPKMGRTVGRLSDVAIVTDEEPYTEDPLHIREDILLGFKAIEDGAKVEEIGDRKEAITRAITMAKTGDTVLITGMGHQKYRVIGEVKEPWDDREVARDILKNHKR